MEAHLALCPACCEELAFWREVGAAVTAENAALPAPPPALAPAALARARSRPAGVLARAWALLYAQSLLLRREMRLASALVMALGYVAAVLMGERAGSVVEAVAPLVAAGSLSAIYGAGNDPGLELALATPTSPRQVLLSRLVVVFGYDLLLALAATVGLVAVVPLDWLGAIILRWLAPMTFLSALALVLSMCVGTGNAITVAFALWLARAFGGVDLAGTGALEATFIAAARAYAQVWATPALLFGLSALLVAAALGMAGRQERLLLGQA
jgi:hypothetical protein